MIDEAERDDQESREDRQPERGDAWGPRRFSAATFGLGAAALAGVITMTGHAGGTPASASETAAHAVLAAAHDAPINLNSVRPCTTSTTVCGDVGG